MDEKVIEITIPADLNTALVQLQGALWRAMTYLIIALRSPYSDDVIEAGLPEVALQMRFSAPTTLPAEQLAVDYRAWQLGNAFRDIAEALGAFLEAVRQVSAFWRLTNYSTAPSTISGEDWSENMVAAKKRFHQAGLPEKLATLSDAFGIKLASFDERFALSINAARNCLVHRRGIVAPRDADQSGRLEIAWKRMAIIGIDNDGENEIAPGAVVGEGGRIEVRTLESAKTFAVGERVSFSPHEFSELAMALYFFFAGAVNRAAEDAARSKGMRFNAPAESSPPEQPG